MVNGLPGYPPPDGEEEIYGHGHVLGDTSRNRAAREARPQQKDHQRMSMRDRIKQESANGGFQAHPLGVYEGIVEEVKQKTLDSGQVVFDICIRSSLGKLAKVGIFHTTVADVDSLYNGRMKNRAEAEERYVKAIGRICRLYRDLGVEEPDGETEQEIEDKAFGWLAHLQGRACSIAVQANRQKPGEVSIFINAPKGASHAPALSHTGARVDAGPSHFGGGPTQFGSGLDDIPF